MDLSWHEQLYFLLTKNIKLNNKWVLVNALTNNNVLKHLYTVSWTQNLSHESCRTFSVVYVVSNASQKEDESASQWWRDETQSPESLGVRKTAWVSLFRSVLWINSLRLFQSRRSLQGSRRAMLKLNEHIDLFPLWSGTGAHGNDMCQITHTHTQRGGAGNTSRAGADRLRICDGIR